MSLERRLLPDKAIYQTLVGELVRRAERSTVEGDEPLSYPCIVVMFWQTVNGYPVVQEHAYIYPGEFSGVCEIKPKRPRCTRDFFCSEECQEANYCQHMNDGSESR